MADEPQAPIMPDDEPPPVFSTWSRLYAAVVAYLFALIGLFYLFTLTFNGRR